MSGCVNIRRKARGSTPCQGRPRPRLFARTRTPCARPLLAADAPCASAQFFHVCSGGQPGPAEERRQVASEARSHHGPGGPHRLLLSSSPGLTPQPPSPWVRVGRSASNDLSSPLPVAVRPRWRPRRTGLKTMRTTGRRRSF